METKSQTVPIFPPSLGDACPRSGCGLKMSTSHVEDFIVVQCPSCGYAVKEISGSLKLKHRDGILERTAQLRSQG